MIRNQTKAQSYYVAKVAKIPGIYRTWKECSLQTNGFSGALFKKFQSPEEALDWLYDGCVPESVKSNIYHEKLKRSDGLGLTMVNVPNSLIEHFNTRILDKFMDPKTQKETETFYYGQIILPMATGVINKKSYHLCPRECLNTFKYLLMIYVDGSKRPSIKHRGSGAYARFNGQDYFMSCPFTDAIGHKYEILPSDFESLSSPTMEYLAFTEVLWRFISIKLPEVNGIPQILNPRLKLVFVSDYLGVKCFTDGSWTPKEDYIKKIKNISLVIIGFLKERGIDVEVIHHKGHEGILGNELSDIAAKSPTALDTISLLVQHLSLTFEMDFRRFSESTGRPT